MAITRSTESASHLDRKYGSINLLATWRDGLDNISFIHQTIDPGKQTRMHYHPYEEIFFLLDGEAIAQVEDSKYRISPGECVVLFSGEPHKFINPRDKKFESVIALSPHRDPEKVVYLE